MLLDAREEKPKKSALKIVVWVVLIAATLYLIHVMLASSFFSRLVELFKK